MGSAPICAVCLRGIRHDRCPGVSGVSWRAVLRLGRGDGNAIAGLLGLTFGIWIGTLFLKKRLHNLGRAEKTHTHRSVG